MVVSLSLYYGLRKHDVGTGKLADRFAAVASKSTVASLSLQHPTTALSFDIFSTYTQDFIYTSARYHTMDIDKLFKVCPVYNDHPG